MVDRGIVWLKDDFRINDNPALSFATNNHEFVSVIYIYNKSNFDRKREAQKWWIYKSLINFKSDLSKINVGLEVVSNDEINFFSKLDKKNKFTVYWNKVYEPSELIKDENIIKNFIKSETKYKCFKGNILNEFNEITKNDGTPFKVYTPFWRSAEKYYLDKVPSKEYNLKKLKNIKIFFKDQFDLKKILPKHSWYKKFENYWDPSENTAHSFLDNFIANEISGYGLKRDFPAIKGTSKLSPYIRNGQINVNYIWKKCTKIKSKNISIKKFLNEIGWREFSHSLINYFPQMLKGNLRKEFDKFPWVKNQNYLSAWKKGMTGYPIVDAGMRELYETGWMHNRIRMVVGSFLVKHLRINWKEGEKHFRNCLFDFNEANNIAQWQWVAGCGADAAPYFRIFNPILQGEKFDNEGQYVKRWVPELNKVPKKFIHKPWEMETKYQEAINTIIGKDYPKPIVIHEEARAAALNAFQTLKKK